MERKKVAVIFTGGTISMKIDEKLQAAIPSLSSDEIIAKVTGIEGKADLEIINFGKYPGPHITPQLMMEISQKTEELLKIEDIAAVVITHGTDTLEETAYFLDLTINSSKPVVITGAMRNSSELGYDGPANLAAAICTAISEASKNKGVLVVMNNEVNAASEVTKTHTLSLNTFQSMDFGPLGIVDQDEVIYYRDLKKRQYIPTNKVESRVSLIKTAVGMNSDFLYYGIESGVKGFVIEGMGRGNVPPEMVPGIKEAIEKGIPVVLVSRCPKGRVLDSYGYSGGGRELKNLGVILGDNLSGQKARVKLMVVLGLVDDMDKIKNLFKNAYSTIT